MRFDRISTVLLMTTLCTGSAGAWSPAQPPQMPPPVIEVEARLTGPGCPSLPQRSPFTGKRATVFFHNKNGQQPLKLYWIDGIGNWEKKEEIAPGKSTSISTIIGARWVLVDQDGKCVSTTSVSLPNTTVIH